MLLTRSRLCPRASPGSSLHLHVLSTPPAFVLSQDQTLREELHEKLSWTVTSLTPEGAGDAAAGTHTRWSRTMTGYFSAFDSLPSPSTPIRRPATGRTWTHTTIAFPIVDAHAVEFSKTAGPPEGGFPLGGDRPTRRPGAPLGRPASIARRDSGPPPERYARGPIPLSAGPETRPAPPGGARNRPGTLAGGLQAHETPPPDPQDLPVGRPTGDVVLPGSQRLLPQRHAPLVDQPPGLRPRDPELPRDQLGQVDRAPFPQSNSLSLISSGFSRWTNTRSKCSSAALASSGE